MRRNREFLVKNREFQKLIREFLLRRHHCGRPAPFIHESICASMSASTLLDRLGLSADVGVRAAEFNQRRNDLKAGTVLVREWDGQQHRVMVLADGFAWKDKIYPSLTKVAFALTGTRWNGPRFFGLRDGPTPTRRT